MSNDRDEPPAYRGREWRDERPPRRWWGSAEVLLIDGPRAGERLTVELGPPYAVVVPYVSNRSADPLAVEYGQTTYDLHPTTTDGFQRLGVSWVGVSGSLPTRREVSLSVDPAVVFRARFDVVVEIEQRAAAELAAAGGREPAVFEWWAELWPEEPGGEPTRVRWDRSAPTPAGARLFICRAQERALI